MSPQLKEQIIDSLQVLNPKSISVFGSYARGEQRPDSDIDLLVEYHYPLNFFQIVRAIRNLESKISVKVDLLDKNAASDKFLNSIQSDLKSIYNETRKFALN